jgi:hypothetical protein
MREANYHFYCRLIRELEFFHEEEIPTSIFITEELRRVFEVEYVLTEAIFEELVRAAGRLEPDKKSQEVLELTAGYLGLPVPETGSSLLQPSPLITEMN